MKRIMFLGCCLFIATACEKLPTTEATSASTSYPIRFSVDFKEEVLPFPPTKSMPANNIAEPEVTEPVAETARFNQIEYIVYQEEENALFKQRHYTNEEEGFGMICDSLPEGNYKIAFLAHSAPNARITEDNIFSADSVSDTFFLQKDITVIADAEIEESVILKRVVSRIEFIATDPVPSKLAQFDVEITDYPNQFDILKGVGIPDNEQPFTLSHLYMSKEINQANTKHIFYSFVPASASSVIGIKLNALDNVDMVYFSRSVEVRPQVNKIIRYKGKLYAPPASNDTFNMEVDGKWEATEENELQDQKE